MCWRWTLPCCSGGRGEVQAEVRRCRAQGIARRSVHGAPPPPPPSPFPGLPSPPPFHRGSPESDWQRCSHKGPLVAVVAIALQGSRDRRFADLICPLPAPLPIYAPSVALSVSAFWLLVLPAVVSFRFAYVPSQSMAPTLSRGDLLLAERNPQQLSNGDIVLFKVKQDAPPPLPISSSSMLSLLL